MYCGKTVELNKIPLGVEVGLGPGHIVLDGDTAPPKGAQYVAATFRPMSIIVAKRSPISATVELLFLAVTVLVASSAFTARCTIYA